MEVGQTLAGHKADYRLVERLEGSAKISTVFKAETLPRHAPAVASSFVLIKSATANDGLSGRGLRREYDAYQTAAISASLDVRSLVDIIGEPHEFTACEWDRTPCLVLEWLEHTLQDVPRQHHKTNLILIREIFRAVLSGLRAFETEKLIHSDLKPDNILISGMTTGNPTVKIGDLGLVRADGWDGEAQPWAMRAPEVYRGLGCFHRSDVWALAATVFCWMEPDVFGLPGNVFGLPAQIWCVAKLMVLFPGWKGPPIASDLFERAFSVAEQVSYEYTVEEHPEKIIKISSLQEEMRQRQINPILADLFTYLFVVDPEQRPSAAEALESAEYLALERAAAL